MSDCQHTAHAHAAPFADSLSQCETNYAYFSSLCVLFSSLLPQDLQAIDRTHRIGQTKKVVVYRLLTKGTYEMEMFHRSCLKLTLDHVVMASMSQEIKSDSSGDSKTQAALANRGNANDKKKGKGKGKDGEDGDSSTIPFDKAEVELMLKNGAYNIFCDTGKDSEANELKSLQFAEEDIDHILQRSQVMKYATDKEGEAIAVEGIEVPDTKPAVNQSDANGNGNGNGIAPSEEPTPDATAAATTATSGNSKSSFSKASFVPMDGGEELSLSDPLFWQKIGLVDRSEKDPSLEPAPVLDGKRIRKPVQSFNSAHDEDEVGVTSGARGVDVLGKKRTGPARCQICQLITRDDEKTPILICDSCEDELHLSCLGLFAIPAEDFWRCPSCVREAKKGPRKQGDGDEDDDDYRPDPSVLGVLSKSSALGKSSAARHGGIVSTSSATEQLAQYERLLARFRISHPNRAEGDYKTMADRLWRTIFNSDPPTPIATNVTTTTVSNATPQSYGFHSDVNKLGIKKRSVPVKETPPKPVHQPQPTAKQATATTAQATQSSSQSQSSSQPQQTQQQWTSSYYQQQQQQQLNQQFMSPAYSSYSQQYGQSYSMSYYPYPGSHSSQSAYGSLSSSTGAPQSTLAPSSLSCSAPGCTKLDGQSGLPPFNACGRCLRARYCSKECQLAHWRAGHKAECKPPTSNANINGQTSKQ